MTDEQRGLLRAKFLEWRLCDDPDWARFLWKAMDEYEAREASGNLHESNLDLLLVNFYARALSRDI